MYARHTIVYALFLAIKIYLALNLCVKVPLTNELFKLTN